jgi:hypothetical protein
MADFGIGGAAGSGKNNNNINSNVYKNLGFDANEFSKIFADLMGEDELEIKEKKDVFRKELLQTQLSKIPNSSSVMQSAAASHVFEVKKFFKKAGIKPEFDLTEDDYKHIHKSLVAVLDDENLLRK